MKKKTLLKGTAWLAAPETMFALKAPKKAAMLKAADWAWDRVRPHRRRSHTLRNTGIGLAAAALAVPVGLFVGNYLRQRDES